MDLSAVRALAEKARERISKYIHHTPLEVSTSLSEETGAEVYLKLENEQVMGSVKVRGALNKLSLLLESGNYNESNPPTTSSSGNHALACVYAQRVLKMWVLVYVPTTISRAKDEHLRQAGVEVFYHGNDCVDSETMARSTAEENGTVYISPYNDLQIMAGQGIIGLEILEDLSDVDAVFVSVGGGGLIAGIAAVIKSIKPDVKVIGCQPRRSKVMYESVKVGRIVEETAGVTLSDGTAGGVEDRAVTLPYCQLCVDDWVLVDEPEISHGVFTILKHHHKVIEGASGVVVAAFRHVAAQYQGQKVALVMCGGNMGVDTLKQIIDDNINKQS